MSARGGETRARAGARRSGLAAHERASEAGAGSGAVATAGLGEDGAGIGVSSASGRRPARSPSVGWQRASRRGRAPGGAERHDVVRRDEQRAGARPPNTEAGAAGTSRSQSLAFRKEPTHSSPFGTSEPSRRQEMVLPSSRLGLGPRTSSSPSSSDSRICCTGNHYTPPQEPAPKVKPKDPHRRRQHHRKRAAPRRHRPPRRFHHLGRAPARAGDHPSRPPPAPPSLPSLPTFLSLLFLPSFSLCPWLSSPAPGTPHPPKPLINLHY